MSKLNYIAHRLKIDYDLLKSLSLDEIDSFYDALGKKYLIDCNSTELGKRILKYFLFYKDNFHIRMMLDDAIDDGRISDANLIVKKIHRDNLSKES